MRTNGLKIWIELFGLVGALLTDGFLDLEQLPSKIGSLSEGQGK